MRTKRGVGNKRALASGIFSNFICFVYPFSTEIVYCCKCFLQLFENLYICYAKNFQIDFSMTDQPFVPEVEDEDELDNNPPVSQQDVQQDVQQEQQQPIQDVQQEQQQPQSSQNSGITR